MTSGLEHARRVFDFYGEEIGRELSSCYNTDTTKARVVRVSLAIISGIFKVLLFPIACAAGLICLPLYGLKRVFFNEEKKIDPRQFDSPCVGAVFCGFGLIATFGCLGAATYGYLSLNQTVNLLLSVIAISITINVAMALRNHAKKPPLTTERLKFITI
jgi:hypothetical protein